MFTRVIPQQKATNFDHTKPNKCDTLCDYLKIFILGPCNSVLSMISTSTMFTRVIPQHKATSFDHTKPNKCETLCDTLQIFILGPCVSVLSMISTSIMFTRVIPSTRQPVFTMPNQTSATHYVTPSKSSYWALVTQFCK